ncbi:3-hydroxyisobutyrate dehydrogenase [Prauserella aidingensis]|uniref:NAD(P)-dependent oxidoreductase n=1 Tax=Prauserella aidingensis TaxID=387890 RepID=UPI0020A3618E|nr:NAD(P)-dependent oxidoreductase [Prauserella aidingensis]MCP2252721.1 3-hydroxyisobutyrate dehydrogenase [Prauserella aidingensis]
MTTLFVGLGRMGSPMAQRYAARYPTMLFDVDTAVSSALAGELGAEVVPSLTQLPDGIDAVILMLPDSRVVESVLLTDGLLAALPPGALVIDMSSSEPASTRDVAQRARAAGIGYVDAPVSGGVAKALTGELSIMVGGAEADVARARQHLEPLGSTVHAVGPSGAGHAAKALNNLVSATNVAAAAEVLTVATSFGIDPAVMVEVLNSSTGRSQASEVKYPRHVLTGTYDSGFAMDLMIKDLGMARALADELGATAPVTAAAFETALAAREQLGGAGLDHTELARYYETVNNAPLGRPGDGTGRSTADSTSTADGVDDDRVDDDSEVTR